MKSKNKNHDETESFHHYESYQPHLQPIDSPSSGNIQRANKWLKKHWKPVLGALGIIAVGIGLILFYLFSHLQFATSFAVTAAHKKQEQKYYSPLTGVEVSKEDTQRPVTGVMIENSPDARPQSGLYDAGVIFESVAEGGITRFLALYQEGKPSSIGPVRSVRPQFASWVAAFDAGLAHVGGSDIPLQKLRSGQIKDLDQFFNPTAYSRVSSRAAPHNVYTSADKLQALNISKKYTSSYFTGWKRKTKETPSKTANATTVTVPVSTGMYTVNYAWDQNHNTYLRKEGNTAHMDREKGQLAPKVVIALQIPHNVIRDSNGYSYPDVIGSGNGWLFQDGIVTEIHWQKSSDKSQLEFTDAVNGQVVELEAGQTWITAITVGAKPTWN